MPFTCLGEPELRCRLLEVSSALSNRLSSGRALQCRRHGRTALSFHLWSPQHVLWFQTSECCTAIKVNAIVSFHPTARIKEPIPMTKPTCTSTRVDLFRSHAWENMPIKGRNLLLHCNGNCQFSRRNVRIPACIEHLIFRLEEVHHKDPVCVRVCERSTRSVPCEFTICWFQIRPHFETSRKVKCQTAKHQPHAGFLAPRIESNKKFFSYKTK